MSGIVVKSSVTSKGINFHQAHCNSMMQKISYTNFGGAGDKFQNFKTHFILSSL